MLNNKTVFPKFKIRLDENTETQRCVGVQQAQGRQAVHRAYSKPELSKKTPC